MALPTKPATPVPTWATDTNYTTGDDIGLTTKGEPTTGETAEGHFRGKRPPARKINWLKHWICQWLAWAEAAIDSLDTYLGTAVANFTSAIASQAIELTNAINLREARYKSYDIVSVTNETSVDEIAPVNVKGTCIRFGRAGSAGAVTVHFHVPYEPNAAGEKSFDLSLLADADWIPAANFASEIAAYGHATAKSGDVRSAAQVYAIAGTKTVRVSWDDSVAAPVAGTSFVRGSFSYPFTLPS
jgi:hypothetical protein